MHRDKRICATCSKEFPFSPRYVHLHSMCSPLFFLLPLSPPTLSRSSLHAPSRNIAIPLRSTDCFASPPRLFLLITYRIRDQPHLSISFSILFVPLIVRPSLDSFQRRVAHFISRIAYSSLIPLIAASR